MDNWKMASPTGAAAVFEVNGRQYETDEDGVVDMAQCDGAIAEANGWTHMHDYMEPRLTAVAADAITDAFGEDISDAVAAALPAAIATALPGALATAIAAAAPDVVVALQASVTTGGIIFPTSDPQIAGAWWDSAGTLTKSTGPGG